MFTIDSILTVPIFAKGVVESDEMMQFFGRVPYTRSESKIGRPAGSKRRKSTVKKWVVFLQYYPHFFTVDLSAAFNPAGRPIFDSLRVYVLSLFICCVLQQNLWTEEVASPLDSREEPMKTANGDELACHPIRRMVFYDSIAQEIDPEGTDGVYLQMEMPNETQFIQKWHLF